MTQRLLTDWVRMSRAEQTIVFQAIHSPRRHFHEVEALGVVAPVDDLEGGNSLWRRGRGVTAAAHTLWHMAMSRKEKYEV